MNMFVVAMDEQRLGDNNCKETIDMQRDTSA
jgi:hypothetical protein